MFLFDLTGSGTFSFGTFIEELRVIDLPSCTFGTDEELFDLDRTIDAITLVTQNERKNAKLMPVLREDKRLDVCFEGLYGEARQIQGTDETSSIYEWQGNMTKEEPE
jgi:hypothetical protein